MVKASWIKRCLKISFQDVDIVTDVPFFSPRASPHGRNRQGSICVNLSRGCKSGRKVNEYTASNGPKGEI